MLTFQSNEMRFFANTIAQCRICSIWSLLALKLSAVKGWNHTADCCGRFKESFRIIITFVTFSHTYLWNWTEGMLNWLERKKKTFFEHQLHPCQLVTTWANYEITSLSQGANLRVLSANKWHMFCSRCRTETTDWYTQYWLAPSGQSLDVQRP